MAAAPTPPYIPNASFETGDLTGWTFNGGSHLTYTVTSNAVDVASGSRAVRMTRSTGGVQSAATGSVQMSNSLPVYPGQSINVSARVRAYGEGDEVGGSVSMIWFNSSNVAIGHVGGNTVSVNLGQGYRLSTATGTAPAGAASVTFTGAAYIVRPNGVVCFDDFQTNYTYDAGATLVSPTDGSAYKVGDPVPFNVNITGTTRTPVSVEYISSVDGSLATMTGSSWATNISTLTEDTHSITAKIIFNDATEVTTAAHSVTIGEDEPEPTTDPREYRASNAYTFLVAENINGLASQIPVTAVITGVEVILDYEMQAMIRASEVELEDQSESRNPLFDIIKKANLEAVLFTKNGEDYTLAGTPMIEQIDILKDDFDTVEEEGVSEEKKWTVLTGASGSATIGGESLLFGIDYISAFDFYDRAIGVRFVPVLESMPEYAGSGDAVIRFMLDKLKVRVYFDAGSIDYYFASPGYTDIIKGTLVSSYVESGDLRTGDAQGNLQLKPELVTMEGSAEWINNGWTIHAAYPPTEANQIGVVDSLDSGFLMQMEYNGLPTQTQVRANRSRYQFITENFYGDPDYNSLYGVHGLPRAFSYNGDFFYKIFTQPDPEKDSPRSVANHHGHLALGYHGGRVDLSVVGQPYNYNGVEGASSWAFGDKVVGLLPLSGTILGVFGSKSIWGISGTTVDNFATQVVSPNIGAIEYTICDMGFPVYANAYGVYTLSQTQEYGDYLGQPMSRDVSPWLRPRLLRKDTSDKEVVCAWPVRSKNQYRLAFSDGYVMSMTLNGQQLPTFSKQMYMADGQALIPIALSSELDEGGEERIHIAGYGGDTDPPEPVGLFLEWTIPDGDGA